MEKDFVNFLDYHVYRYDDKNELITDKHNIEEQYKQMFTDYKQRIPSMYTDFINNYSSIKRLNELFKSSYILINSKNLNFQDSIYLILNKLSLNYYKVEIYNNNKTKWIKFIKCTIETNNGYHVYNVNYKNEHLTLNTNVIINNSNYQETVKTLYVLLTNTEYFQTLTSLSYENYQREEILYKQQNNNYQLEIEKLKQELIKSNSLEKLNKDFQSLINSYKFQYETFDKQVKELQDKNNENLQQLIKDYPQTKTLNKIVNEQNNEISKLKKENKSLKEEVDKLKVNLSKLIEENKEIKKENVNLKILNKKYVNIDQTDLKLIRENNALNSKIEELYILINSSSKDELNNIVIKELKEKINELNLTISEEKDKNSKLLKENETYKDKLNSLKKVYDGVFETIKV